MGKIKVKEGKMINIICSEPLKEREHLLLNRWLFSNKINRGKCSTFYLMEDLENFPLANIHLLVGEVVLNKIAGKIDIEKWRGSVFMTPFGKVLPILEPYRALADNKWNKVTREDILKLKTESLFPEIRAIPRTVYKVGVEEVLNWTPKSPLAFDIETAGQQITSISFSSNPSEAFVIPLQTFSEFEEAQCWVKIGDVLEDEKIKLFAQNACFDMTVLERSLGIKTKGLILDTMLAFHCLYAELPKSLAFLCSLYTDQPYYKDTSVDDLYIYNGLDTMITFEVAEKLIVELNEANLFEFYHTQIHPLIPVVNKMQVRGIKINNDKKDKVALYEETKLLNAYNTLDVSLEKPLNINSPKQLKEFLYDDIGLIPIKDRKTGALSTNNEAMMKLKSKYGGNFFDLVLELRKKQKLLSTYLKGKVDDDGRFRCSYNIAGTVSGRFSSSKNIWGTGHNLQNVPKGLCRSFFIPDDGNVFLEFDLSQAEARVVAWLANALPLIDGFERGVDIHTENAKRIFGEYNKELRTLAKKLVHAANYGIGSNTFAYIAGIPVSRAKECLKLFFKTYPEIKYWQASITQQIKQIHYLVTPLGRKRQFFGYFSAPDAYSYIPQSTIGDLLNRGMGKVFNAGYEVMLQVHDSILVQVNIGKEEKAIKEIKELLTIPFKINGRELVVPVEVEMGMNWGEMKEVRTC